jgi:hypothetical protein
MLIKKQYHNIAQNEAKKRLTGAGNTFLIDVSISFPLDRLKSETTKIGEDKSAETPCIAENNETERGIKL